MVGWVGVVMEVGVGIALGNQTWHIGLVCGKRLVGYLKRWLVEEYCRLGGGTPGGGS